MFWFGLFLLLLTCYCLHQRGGCLVQFPLLVFKLEEKKVALTPTLWCQALKLRDEKNQVVKRL
ncbi:hypothetical protein AAHE18_05G254300 [Arachis hypogaea]